MPQPSLPDTEPLDALDEMAMFAADQYAIVQPRGVVTGELIETYGRAIAYHPDWQPGFTEVWDLTFSQGVDASPSDISRLNTLEHEIKDFLQGSQTIAITSRSLILYSVQFYARLVRPLGRDVVGVRSRAEAAAILGIDHLPVLSPG